MKKFWRTLIKKCLENVPQKYTWSLKVESAFFTELAFLLRSDVSVVESCEMLAAHASKKHAGLLQQCVAKLHEGYPLTRALATSGIHVRTVCNRLLEVAERAGRLSENVALCAQELEKSSRVRAKLIGALLYPAFIVFAALALSSLIILYVLPKITPIFASMHIAIPLSTRVLFFISDHFLAIVGGVVVVCLSGVVLYLRNTKVKIFAQKVLWRMPVLGALVQAYDQFQMWRVFGLMIESGVPIAQTMFFSLSVSVREVVKQKANFAAEEVSRGQQVSDIMKLLEMPHLSVSLCRVAEKSGMLHKAAAQLHSHYEGTFDEKIKTLTSAIEPLLMIVIGLVVGFIAISVISPIYEITSHIKK